MSVPKPEQISVSQKLGLLRVSTMGSVDDGKSTLIGRLLVDSAALADDTVGSIARKSAIDASPEGLSLALVTDGLKDEREQGITIDVAYRYFSTKKRRVILADTPGHEQYTRNMATGASTADVAMLLIDARQGVKTQTKRHAFIASLIGVPRFLVVINKMDLVDFSNEKFESIVADFSDFCARLGVAELRFIPVSALLGDNVSIASKNMPWYHGETVLDYIETVYVEGDKNLVDFRFPVQGVLRPSPDVRCYLGEVASGSIRVGEEVLHLPSYRKTKVVAIDRYPFDPATTSDITEVAAPYSTALRLADEIDIGRGDMLTRPLNMPLVVNDFEAMLIWMGNEPFAQSKRYILRHGPKEARVQVQSLRYRVNINNLHREETDTLAMNEIARCVLASTSQLYLDPYQKNRATGGFILVDPDNFQTVAAGLVIDRMSDQQLSKEQRSLAKDRNLHAEPTLVSKTVREHRSGDRALTIWCTGLSGSGKSTLTRRVELKLFEAGRPVFRLDGDVLRTGLCSDLGFSASDRRENIRRVAEVAKLFNMAGITVLCSLISPFSADRAMAKDIIGGDNFIEIFVKATLADCEQRDPHGLYKKARAGQIKDFTGISSPYEEPQQPALVIDTSAVSEEEGAELVLRILS